MMTLDEQIAYLTKGAAETIRVEELRAKLERSERTGKPLRAKLGVDPTAPDLHLGHTVVLRKLKHFQDLGHTAIFLIGDFTALVGDPTGQSETRPQLTREQVEENAKTYLQQVYKILGPNKTEVRYNSEWLGKLTSYEMIHLCAHYRLARMLEREDFRSRLAAEQDAKVREGFYKSPPKTLTQQGPQVKLPGAEKARLVNRPESLALHELLYPLLQAYDSVVLEADVELGATEQKVNLLIGREIQREYGQVSQVIMTMPILEGLDGVQKMSKSLGNFVGINEPPAEMFGKIMSISDDLMWRYYELLTDLPSWEITKLEEDAKTGRAHPLVLKKQLAHLIVADFHGELNADQALKDFEAVHRDRSLPSVVKGQEFPLGRPRKLFRLLTDLKLFESKAEAQRKIREGAVYMSIAGASKLEWERLTDPTWELDPHRYPGPGVIFRIGPRRLYQVWFTQEREAEPSAPAQEGS